MPVGRLQSQQQANSLPPTSSGGSSNKGFLGNVVKGADDLASGGWNFLKNAWSTFTYWESRPSQAIETGIAKAVGVPKAQNLNPWDVFTGKEKTDLSGNDIVKQVTGVTSDSPWYYKAPAWIGGLGVDITTDPFMYLSADGLVAKTGELFDEGGKSLGVLSRQGIKELQNFSKEKTGVSDLTKASADIIEQGKGAIRDRVIAGEGRLVTPRGIKFAGRTLVSGSKIDSVAEGLRHSAMADWIKSSSLYDKTQSIFNPRWTKEGNLPDEFYHDALDTFRSRGVQINAQAAKQAVGFFGKISAQDSADFYKLANDAENVVGKPGSALAGISKEELRKIVPASMSDAVVDHYHRYLNEFRPYWDNLAVDGGLDEEHLKGDYIRNVYGDSPLSSKFGEAPKPIKKLRAAYMRGRISDEEFVAGFLKSSGSSDEVIKSYMDTLKGGNAMEFEGEKLPSDFGKLHDVAQKLRVDYGLREDPVLSMATEIAEKTKRKNLVDFIDRTVAKFGTKITKEEVAAYEKAGYGIYTPKTFFTNRNASDMYAFENKGISDYLNRIFTKTPDSSIGKGFRVAAARLINLYFFNPLTAVYHAVHNVGYNSWLSGGMGAFDNLTKAVEDVRDESELYHMALDSGAIRPKYDFKSVEDHLSELMGDETSHAKSFYGMLNPLGRENIGNKLFYASDEAMRMNLFRNALQRGSSPREASDFVNHFAGNWKNTTDVEKTLFQMLYPYYSWFKTNVKANFGSWVTNPDRQLIPIKVWNMLNEAYAGRPLWENAQGAGWKIATGQKDGRGREIYVTPAVSGNIVPELVQNPVLGIASKMLSGPIPEAISFGVTGKDTYSNLYGISSPYADTGAPFSSRAMNAFERLVAPQGGDVLQLAKQKGPSGAMIQSLTGWDVTHPLWENIVNTFLQSYSGGVEPTWIQNYYNARARQKYIKDLKRYNTKRG